MLQRKVIGSEQAGLPWAVLEVTGHKCKLSMSYEEDTQSIIELGIEHEDYVYAPCVLG